MNKKTMIAVFALFAVPVVVATLMHSEWIDWRPTVTKNHGDLIVPVIPLPASAQSDDGSDITLAVPPAGLWQLVYYTKTPCDEDCLEQLYWLKQIRLGQDRHVPEVGLWLIHEPTLPEGLRDQVAAISDQYVIVSGDSAMRLGQYFPEASEAPSRYIVDPQNNIMMRYGPKHDPDGIRKDLSRLLTWTKTNR